MSIDEPRTGIDYLDLIDVDSSGHPATMQDSGTEALEGSAQAGSEKGELLGLGYLPDDAPAAAARARTTARAAEQAAAAAAADQQRELAPEELAEKAWAVFGEVTLSAYESSYAETAGMPGRRLRAAIKLLPKLEEFASMAGSFSAAGSGRVAALFPHLPEVVQHLRQEGQQWTESNELFGLKPAKACASLSTLQGFLLSQQVHTALGLTADADARSALSQYFDWAREAVALAPTATKGKKRRGSSRSGAAAAAAAGAAAAGDALHSAADGRRRAKSLERKRIKTAEKQPHRPAAAAAGGVAAAADVDTSDHDTNAGRGADRGANRGTDRGAANSSNSGSVHGGKGAQPAAAAAQGPEGVVQDSEADEDMGYAGPTDDMQDCGVAGEERVVHDAAAPAPAPAPAPAAGGVTKPAAMTAAEAHAADQQPRVAEHSGPAAAGPSAAAPPAAGQTQQPPAQDPLEAALAAAAAATALDAEAERSAAINKKRDQEQHAKKALAAERDLDEQVQRLQFAPHEWQPVKDRGYWALVDAVADAEPDSLLACNFWCTYEYLLELLPAGLADPQPDVLDAVKQGWKELLSIESPPPPAAAAADADAGAAATAAKHQADITAAERFVRSTYGPLQLSLGLRVQFRAAMQQLLRLPPNDVLVQRFWTDYQPVEGLLQGLQGDVEQQQQQQQLNAATDLLRSLLDTAAVTASVDANDEQHVRDVMRVVDALRVYFKQLGPSPTQQLRYLDKTSLSALLPLPKDDVKVKQLTEEWKWCDLLKTPEDLEAGCGDDDLISTLTKPFLGAAEISDRFDDVWAAGRKLQQLLPDLHPSADLVLGLMKRQRQLYCPTSAGAVDMFLWDVQALARLLEPEPHQKVSSEQLQEAEPALRRLLGYDLSSSAPGTLGTAHHPLGLQSHQQAILTAGKLVRELAEQLKPGFQELGFSWWRLQLRLSELVQELLQLPADAVRVARFYTDVKWLVRLDGLLSAANPVVKQEPQSGDQHQHQQQQQAAAALQLADMVLISSMAQTAFRALLINAPGATATAAGASVEGITQLIAEESAVLDLCQQLLPVAKQLHYKRRLRLLLQMLYSISSDNVRVKYFFSRIRRVQHIPQEQYLDALMMTAEKYDVRTLAPVEGATAVAALPGAMQHVCQLCSLLGVSSNQQQQGLQAAVNVAQGLQCGDGRVEGFWNDYEWLLEILQDGHTRPEATWDAVNTLIRHITARPGTPLQQQHLRALAVKERNIRMLFPRLHLTIQDRLKLRQLLEHLAGLQPDDVAVTSFQHTYDGLLDSADDMTPTDSTVVHSAFMKLLGPHPAQGNA